MQDQDLAVIPFAEPSPSRDIGLVWRARSARRSEYLAFATHIRDVLASDVPEVTPLP
jgi:LysR family hydrogen peroxide-inducible transcriptional activator